jgi:hypothetical protein
MQVSQFLKQNCHPFTFVRSAWRRACVSATAGHWSQLIQLSFSTQELSSFISNTLLNIVTIPHLQRTNPHELCVQAHAVAARMQLQWMCGSVSDVGFMRVSRLLLLFAYGILDMYKHLPPFVAAWRRVCSTAEAIVQHTSHVLMMTTGYREAVGGAGTAAAAVAAAARQFHQHIPRGHVHFAFRLLLCFETLKPGAPVCVNVCHRRFKQPVSHDTLYSCGRLVPCTSSILCTVNIPARCYFFCCLCVIVMPGFARRSVALRIIQLSE